MLSEETKRVMSDILKYKGKRFEVLFAIEEMSELIKELIKDINRDKDNRESIFEEIADVTVQLEYLKRIYDFSDEEIYEYINKRIPGKWGPQIEKWKVEENK